MARGLLCAFVFVFASVVWARDIVRIDGSSTVYPITEAAAEEFQKATRGKVRVTVGVSGTGGGFKKFCRGKIDINNASRPIKQKEIELCLKNGINFVELPVAFDAIAVVVNPANDWVDWLSVEELRKIWAPESQGKITRWSQVREGFPDYPLRLFGPGTDSGTFDYFTEAIVGQAGASRGDYVASEDDNVLVQGVARDRYALGYFGFAYWWENRDILKVLGILNPKTRKIVKPSPETVMSGEYYPLSRPLFIYVSTKSLKEKPAVERFVVFYLERAGEFAKEVGYVPLPADAYRKAIQKLKRRVTGSAFKGKGSVGVTLEELLKLELE